MARSEHPPGIEQNPSADVVPIELEGNLPRMILVVGRLIAPWQFHHPSIDLAFDSGKSRNTCWQRCMGDQPQQQCQPGHETTRALDPPPGECLVAGPAAFRRSQHHLVPRTVR